MNDSSGLNLDLALSILRRRLWLALALSGVVLAVTASLMAFLPNVYRASSFVLVEGQQIPQQYVQSTVTSRIENRLHTISQEILSRSRLQRLINEFGLYQALQKTLSSDEIITAMRADIGIEIKGVGTRGTRNTIGFEVSYIGADPRKVMLVANTLASFYIQENLKIRERQAIGTSNFLRGELQQVKERLESQENRIAGYKSSYLGELPGQLEANLKTLERLQAQMQLVSDHLVRAEDRRNELVRQIEQLNGNGAAPLGGSEPDSLAGQIDELERRLVVLRARFSENYPDVIRLKREIATLEERLAGRDEEPHANGSSPTSGPSSHKMRLEAEVAELDTAIKLRTADLQKTRSTIALYQKRIENTPKREQELLLITRDYDSTRELYNSLLKRQEEANLARR